MSHLKYTAQFRQLRQLRRLDPAAATEAEAWLDRLPAYAASLIARGMQAALTRLSERMKAEGGTPIRGQVMKEETLHPSSFRLHPLYDLVIASRKYGAGTTSHADAPVLWWKLAGRPIETPPRRCRLTDPAIQKRLLNYELIDTEVQASQVVRKYRRLQFDQAHYVQENP